MLRHQDYLDISQANDRPTFDKLLVKFAQSLEFGIVSCALVVEHPGTHPVFVVAGNTPEGFVEASKSLAGARRDPVLKRLKRLSVPFIYDQALYVNDLASDLWEEQAAFGLRTGVAMALHLPGGKHFLMGVDREQALPQHDNQMTRLLADLQLLAVHAQDAAVRLLGREVESKSPTPHLTGREKQVLQWTMEGKSAWAVGEILQLSENTINFHLRNVMAKLEVSSKHQAVLKAMSLGLI